MYEEKYDKAIQHIKSLYPEYEKVKFDIRNGIVCGYDPSNEERLIIAVTEGEEILSGESVKIINTENKILIVEKI